MFPISTSFWIECRSSRSATIFSVRKAAHGIPCGRLFPHGGITFPWRFYNDKQRSEAMLSHIPMHRTGKAAEEAAMVCFLASDDASYITGSVNTIDGGWSVGYSRDF